VVLRYTQIGLERDIVVEILQKCLRLTSIFDLKSAFCRDAIKGWIYIESKSVATIYNILDGVHGPMRHRGNYEIRLVDIHDQHLLLNMDVAGSAPPIKVNSWVRIKRGTYREDLGLVKFVTQPTLICDTYVVPRIPMTLDRKRKRGHRTPQLLFDPHAIQEIYGPDAADKRNRVYVFQGEVYEDGLLCREIHMTDLSIEGINATPEELEPFRQSSKIWNEAEAMISPIKVGDWVRVISGTFVGMVGEITEVLSMTVRIAGKRTVGDAMAIRPTWGEAQKDTREVLTRDVRKAFEVGDLVQIIRGLDRGLEGFLVRLEADSAVIYVLPSKQDNFLKNGREVRPSIYHLFLDEAYNFPQIRIKVADVEWKSNSSSFFHATPVASDIPSGRSRYDPAHPEGLPYVPPDPSLELSKRTAERYKHMEVRILKGDAKRHFGVIKGTHKSPEGEELIDVLTSTRVTNSVGIYHIKDLQERL
jgi:ribosomal protein L24